MGIDSGDTAMHIELKNCAIFKEKPVDDQAGT